ncbi:MAG TPA: bifunctional folylpolyglutamate synthase/dihydrofolate synthase [Candidatus Coprenecus stercoravium]|uniref:Dihydrofolate synthase/folylpolyglutamate synthase n=1 Tax=Candidatus Coprenecus stercoravium TaxID=2840735 RepID=A0A9D2GR20_9BACT|nr:bifunctional folylpolyglutamate synthase/dihydrofolate synthase [Candidatus Coprenecus stercoravium]
MMPETTPELDQKYSGCVRKLYSIAPSFQVVGAAGYHPGLETMTDFAAFLGNPHKRLNTIHIAGTNGKGSVAHMLASALASVRPGSRIGLYTSPHLLDFRERIKVISTDYRRNGVYFREIGKQDVVDFLDRAGDFMDVRRPSFFEITTAMALDYFDRMKVDAAVMETGLGGRLDSTNIIIPQLSVITSIGLDHKDILGDTIEKIAAEKAGIIKPGVPVVVGDVPHEAFEVISAVAEQCGSRLYMAGDMCDDCVSAEAAALEADLHSDCQEKNIRTVLTALGVMGLGAVRKESSAYEAIVHAAAFTGLRGRWERLASRPEVICDIGHNVEAVTVSVRQLKELAGGRHLTMVFGMASDKDVEAVLRLLPKGARYVFTQAQGTRAMPCGRLRQMALEAGIACSRTAGRVADAFEAALDISSPDDIVFVGGSSYVVAEALEYWNEKMCNKKVN